MSARKSSGNSPARSPLKKPGQRGAGRGSQAVRTAMVLLMFGIFFTGLIVLFKMIPKEDSESPNITSSHGMPHVQYKQFPAEIFSEEDDPSKDDDGGNDMKQPISGSSSNSKQDSPDKIVGETSTDSSSKPVRPSTFSEHKQATPTRPPLDSSDSSSASSNTTEDATGAAPKKPKVGNADKLGTSTVLLVMASDRPEYLRPVLEKVAEYHPAGAVPIIVSEDGYNAEVATVVADARTAVETQELPDSNSKKVSVKHWHHPSGGERYQNGYFKLCAHYKWALDKVFSDNSTRRVIILEEDLLIANDFFEYFAGVMPYVDDPAENLLGASAWNDNGQAGAVKDPNMIYRSDFFPGLGWMMPRRIWEELGPKWPKAYWDDWLREPKQRRGRHILHPEMCRTYHIGFKGVSNAQYSNYLIKIYLNDQFTEFSTMNLLYISYKRWDMLYTDMVKAAKELSFPEARNGSEGCSTAMKTAGNVRIVYGDLEGVSTGSTPTFTQLAKWAGAMDNIKAGVPRTAYKGIVSLWKNGVKVYLVPDSFPEE